MLYTIQKKCAAENKTLIGLNSHAHSHKERWQLSQTRMHGQTDRQTDRLTDWLTDRLTVEHANCLPLSAHHKHTPHTHRHHKNNETDATHARTEARMERAAQHKTREERREARRELQKQHPGGFDCGDSEKAAPAAVTAPALLCCCSSGWAGLCFGAATSISYIFSRCDCCCLSRCCCWDFAAISNTNCTVFMATNAFLSFFFRSFVLVVAAALAVCTRVSTTSALARHTNGFHFNSFRQR